MPTAIPDVPLINRLGNFDGNINGSFNELSKLLPNFTVFLLRSSNK